MTEAQIRKRNKFLKAKDKMKNKKKIDRMVARSGPIQLLPWYTFLPEDLR